MSLLKLSGMRQRVQEALQLSVDLITTAGIEEDFRKEIAGTEILLYEEMRIHEKMIPWKEWCGIRDVFAHQYSNLDYESAWSTIQSDLPELKAEIEKILKVNEGI